jgi:hypothetical protein
MSTPVNGSRASSSVGSSVESLSSQGEVQEGIQGLLDAFRSMASALVSRFQFGRSFGFNSFNNRRDLNLILGYNDILDYSQYLDRYQRGGIAKAIVDIFPTTTWGSGFEVVEDQSLKRKTTFEKAIDSLLASDKLSLLSKLIRADIQARIGHFSALVIGAPGKFDSELSYGNGIDQIAYFMPLSEGQVGIVELVGQSGLDRDKSDPRFGLPLFYQVNLGGSQSQRTGISRQALSNLSAKVHWTRVIHIAVGLLDNEVYGEPELKSVWNNLDDLYKLVGGGSEAFLRRGWPGLHLDVDKETKISKDSSELKEVKNQLEEYFLGLTNGITTRGTSLNEISAGGNIQFGPNVGSIIDLIAATKRIPRELLLGSELGLRSAESNKGSWNDRISEVRRYHNNVIAKQLFSRLVKFGYLPAPRNENYEIVWPSEEELSEKEKPSVLLTLAQANQAQHNASGQIILTSDEMRDLYLSLEPLPREEQTAPTPAPVIGPGLQPDPNSPDNPNNPAVKPESGPGVN